MAGVLHGRQGSRERLDGWKRGSEGRFSALPGWLLWRCKGHSMMGRRG